MKRNFKLGLVVFFLTILSFSSSAKDSFPNKFKLVKGEPDASCFFGKPEGPCRDDIWSIVPIGSNAEADFSGYLLPLQSDDPASKKIVSFINASDPKDIDASTIITPWVLHDNSQEIVHALNFQWEGQNLFMRSFWAIFGATDRIDELYRPKVFIVGQFLESRYVVWISWKPKGLNEKDWNQFLKTEIAKYNKCTASKPEPTCRKDTLNQYGIYLSKIDLKEDFKQLSKILDRTFKARSKLDRPSSIEY